MTVAYILKEIYDDKCFYRNMKGVLISQAVIIDGWYELP